MVVAQHRSQQLAASRNYILTLLLGRLDLVRALIAHQSQQTILPEAFRQQAAKIKQKAAQLHVADLADLLESLPEEQRLAFWSLIDNTRRGQVLIEAKENVWQSLIDNMSDTEILEAIKPLDADGLARLTHILPHDLIRRLLISLEPHLRQRVVEMMHLERDRVGSIMDFNLITVSDDLNLAAVQQFLHQRKSIPDGTDKLFITDKNNLLQGELALADILIHSPETPVTEVMNTNPITFSMDDKSEKAAGEFERYDLISAAVIDDSGRLIGRVTIEDVVDVVNQESDSNIRKMSGVSPQEDLFAPVRKALHKRWSWLAINLCTAFIASRVVGLFEATISQLVALATLMPIVAGIGGNTGNQTITMIVRALALHQIETGNFLFLFRRELCVAVINGLVWGGIMGIITWILYGNLKMGGVMMLAMSLNLLLAAFMGVMIPLIMTKLKRDPAVGSSVIITAITDTGGFFIFLGLATLFLHQH